MAADATDRRFVAAAIRLSLHHAGRTGTNPSVGCLLVSPAGVIVGRGITALGGRPHAETVALGEAGERARGATAYVTLEPCAHHGRTPPCAEALVRAGVNRVVGAAADPDPRVAGRGYTILRRAGITVEEAVLAEEAASVLAPYLTRAVKKRAHVTLKLALSADGMIGRHGHGQFPITGPVARAQVQMARAASDAILVGIGTALADDPLLSVRLAGLEDRSPVRIVLDRHARLPLGSALVRSVGEIPVLVAAENGAAGRSGLAAAGVGFLAVDLFDGRVALPELLEDLAGRGITSLFVEGGAETARAFLADDCVDRVVLFRGPGTIGSDGIASPLGWDTVPPRFALRRESRFGDDWCREWERIG